MPADRPDDTTPRMARRVARPVDDDDTSECPALPRRSFLPLAGLLGAVSLGLAALVGFAAVKMWRQAEAVRQRAEAESARAVRSERAAVARVEAETPKRTNSPEPQLIDGISVIVTGKRFDDRLMVLVAVGTEDKTRSAHFRGWRKYGLDVLGAPQASDEFGNRYGSTPFDLTEAMLASYGRNDPKFRFGPGGVTSEVTRAEWLFFDPPAQAARWVDLDLPGSALGLDKTFRFRISLTQKESEPDFKETVPPLNIPPAIPNAVPSAKKKRPKPSP